MYRLKWFCLWSSKIFACKFSAVRKRSCKMLLVNFHFLGWVGTRSTNRQRQVSKICAGAGKGDSLAATETSLLPPLGSLDQMARQWRQEIIGYIEESHATFERTRLSVTLGRSVPLRILLACQWLCNRNCPSTSIASINLSCVLCLFIRLLVWCTPYCEICTRRQCQNSKVHTWGWSVKLWS